MWRLEQVVNKSDHYPNGNPLDAELFPMVYGVSAPTLRVRENGLVTMYLGGEIISRSPQRSGSWKTED